MPFDEQNHAAVVPHEPSTMETAKEAVLHAGEAVGHTATALANKTLQTIGLKDKTAAKEDKVAAEAAADRAADQLAADVAAVREAWVDPTEDQPPAIHVHHRAGEHAREGPALPEEWKTDTAAYARDTAPETVHRDVALRRGRHVAEPHRGEREHSFNYDQSVPGHETAPGVSHGMPGSKFLKEKAASVRQRADAASHHVPEPRPGPVLRKEPEPVVEQPGLVEIATNMAREVKDAVVRSTSRPTTVPLKHHEHEPSRLAKQADFGPTHVSSEELKQVVPQMAGAVSDAVAASSEPKAAKADVPAPHPHGIRDVVPTMAHEVKKAMTRSPVLQPEDKTRVPELHRNPVTRKLHDDADRAQQEIDEACTRKAIYGDDWTH